MARQVSSTKDSSPKVDRRKFLTGVAVAGAAGAIAPQAANATVADGTAAARLPSALPPTAHTIAVETGTPPKDAARIGGVAGSDFMVDVIKTLDIKYLPSNCASSFRGIHESLINYGANKMPEFLTCTHEESAVGMAHGYFKITGKPLLTLCHGTVGLQHAAMAIYNAWCDPRARHRHGRQRSRRRAPAAGRADLPFRTGHQRAGSRLHQVGRHAGVAAALRAVDVRAYKISMTPPYGPVMLSLDAGPPAGAGQESRRQRPEALHSEIHPDLGAAGRQQLP
jgi:acetolactate synthase-1/2/3 large subunit